MVLPGAGSSADFVRRAFLRPLRAAGYGLVAPEPVSGADLVRASFRALDAAAAEYGPRLRLVGGVSLGAHTAARWTAASGLGLDGVVLVLPAWTGTPGAVATATAASAELVDLLGTAGALAAAGTAVGWVAAELAVAWPAYGDGLAASLRAAAVAPGPSWRRCPSRPAWSRSRTTRCTRPRSPASGPPRSPAPPCGSSHWPPRPPTAQSSAPPHWPR